MTQTETVLFTLRAYPAGVCATTFLDMRIPRYAARINELRGRFNIATEECVQVGHSHRSRQVQYRLLQKGAML